jgi:hypothetical protein
VIASLIARNIWGGPTVAYSAIAMALCLIPTSATLCWANWAAKQPNDQQFTMLLGGTGVRLFVVLGGAFFLHQALPFLHQQEMPSFWMWVLVCYMFTLAVETGLSVSSINSATAVSVDPTR